MNRNKQDITCASYHMMTETNIIKHSTSMYSIKHKRAAIRHIINRIEKLSVTSAAKRKIIQEDGTYSRQLWVKHTWNNKENNNTHNRSNDECKHMWTKKITTSVNRMAELTYFSNHITTLTKIFRTLPWDLKSTTP
jgi:hypothetical protein